MGADFAWKHDTTALVPFWLPGDGRRVLGSPVILTPPRDGTSMGPEVVRRGFVDIMERNPIRVVAMDPAAGGGQIAEWLEAAPGIDEHGRPSYAWSDGHGLGVEVVEVGPGNTVQCQVYAAFMEAIRTGVLEHPHEPEFTRHVLNGVAKIVTHDRYRFDRVSVSRAARMQDGRVIDALIAASIVHWQQTAGLPPDKDPIMADEWRLIAI